MTYLFDASAKLVAVHVPLKSGLLQAKPSGTIDVWDGCKWRAATLDEQQRWRGVCDEAIKAAPAMRVWMPIIRG